jgi:hypothetical protein
MPATAADIKVFASKTMLDVATGGGPRAATALQDGASNSILPDVAPADRLTGRVAVRKVYMGPVNADTAPVLSASVLVDEAPTDPSVEALVWAFGDTKTVRSQAVAALATIEVRAYGVQPTTAAVAAGAKIVAVKSTGVHTAPFSTTSVALAGSLAQREAWVLVAVGARRSFSFTEQFGSWNMDDAGFLTGAFDPRSFIFPGSIQGTFGAAGVLSQSSVGTGFLGGLMQSQNGATTLNFAVGYTQGLTFSAGMTSAAHPTPAATYQPALLARAPLQHKVLVVTNANQAVAYALDIPTNTTPGSEGARAADGKFLRPVNNGTATNAVQADTGLAASASAPIATAIVDRPAGKIYLTFNAVPAVGSEIHWFFSTAAVAQVLPAALSNSGAFVAGSITAALTAGYELDSANFVVAGVRYMLWAGVVSLQYGGSVGNYNSITGVITVPGLAGAVSGWMGLQSNKATSVSEFVAELPADAKPTTVILAATTAAGANVTAAMDGLKNADGAVIVAKPDLAYSENGIRLTLSSPVKWKNTAYTGQSQSEVSLGTAPGSVSGLASKPVFIEGDIVSLWHEVANAPQTAVAGSALSAGRADLDELAVVGSDGKEVVRLVRLGPLSALATADFVAGTLTPTTLTGWPQPVTLRHRIGHTSVLAASAATDRVTLQNAPSRTFPMGSTLSSHMPVGALAARAENIFSQQAWTRVWSATVIGNPLALIYTGTIAVTNQGCETDRWAIELNPDGTSFRCYSEILGQVATGVVTANFSPINPATGAPFFTLFSSSWAADRPVGGVLRFDTVGSCPPVWALRCVSPGAAAGTTSMALAMTGGVDA